jgi:hypothetical protein
MLASERYAHLKDACITDTVTPSGEPEGTQDNALVVRAAPLQRARPLTRPPVDLSAALSNKQVGGYWGNAPPRAAGCVSAIDWPGAGAKNMLDMLRWK